MSAEILRRAAESIRRDLDDEFFCAVADLLDGVANNHDDTACPAADAALAVARAYLGESA